MKSISIKLLIVPLLICLTEGIFIFNASLRIRDLGGDEFIIGLAVTLSAAAQILLSPFAGRFSDKVGREKIMHAGIFIYIGAMFGLAISPDYLLIIIFTGIHGAGYALFWPALEALIADKSERGILAQNLVLYNVFGSAGAFAGFFASGYIRNLSKSFGGGFPFYTVLIVYVLTAAYSYVLVRPKNKAAATLQEHIEPMTKTERMYLIAGFFIIGSILFNLSIVNWFFPKFAADVGIPDETAGMLLSLTPFAQLATFILLGVLRPKFNSLSFLIAFLLTNIIAFVIFSTTSHIFLLGIATFLVGIAFGGCHSFGQYHTLLHPHSRGAKSGLYMTIASAGGLGGCFFGGLAARLTGSIRAPFILGLALAGLLLAAAFVVKLAANAKSK